MNDAPKKLFAMPNEDDGWRAPYVGRFGDDEATEYRRADLPPDLEQALAVPEVKALVDAVRWWRDCDSIDGCDCANDALDGAIEALDAALEGKG